MGKSKDSFFINSRIQIFEGPFDILNCMISTFQNKTQNHETNVHPWFNHTYIYPIVFEVWHQSENFWIANFCLKNNEFLN